MSDLDHRLQALRAGLVEAAVPNFGDVLARRRRRRAAYAAGGASLVVAGTAIGIAVAGVADHGAVQRLKVPVVAPPSPASARGGQAVQLGDSLAPARLRLSLPNAPYEIAVDKPRDRLWMAVPGPAEGSTLWWYSIADGTSGSFPLGKGTATTGNHVRVAPDGSVWATFDYRVYRLDPETGSVDERVLDEKDPRALPAASSGSNQGTWVSAIDFDRDSNAYIARNNIPAFDELSPSLQPVGSVDIPDADAGPADMVIDSTGVRALPAAISGRGADMSTWPVRVPNAVEAASTSQLLRGHQGLDKYIWLASLAGDTVGWDAGTGTLSYNEPGAQGTIKMPIYTGSVSTDPMHMHGSGGIQPQVRAATFVDNSIWMIIQGPNGPGLYEYPLS